jgi:hypothetical protein
MTEDDIIDLAAAHGLGEVLQPICQPNPTAFATAKGYRTAELLSFSRALLEQAGRSSTAGEPVAVVESIDPARVLWCVDFPNMDMMVKPGDNLYASAAPAVPKGWRLVPEEPTPEMARAIYRAYEGDFTPNGTWRAVLAASTTTPKD